MDLCLVLSDFGIRIRQETRQAGRQTQTGTALFCGTWRGKPESERRSPQSWQVRVRARKTHIAAVGARLGQWEPGSRQQTTKRRDRKPGPSQSCVKRFTHESTQYGRILIHKLESRAQKSNQGKSISSSRWHLVRRLRSWMSWPRSRPWIEGWRRNVHDLSHQSLIRILTGGLRSGRSTV